MTRRAAAALLALLLAGCGGRSPAVPAATARPLRVMSVNQCTDQLVLALLPPERIASVTWLSRRPDGSLLPDRARAVAANHGLVEEVIAQAPDLVVAGSFTTPALRSMLRRLGWPMLEVADAGTVAGIRRATAQVAAAVGEQRRGAALIAAMDGALARLAREPAPPVRVVGWDRTGFAAGRDSLFDAVLFAAGARNVMRGADARRCARPDVELLAKADPAVLVQGSADPGTASLADDVLRHPLVRRRWGGRTIALPQASYICGTPMIADAAIRLRGRLRDAAAADAGGRR